METAKSCETREVPYTCKYTSGHRIPNSVYITKAELGIKCPLVCSVFAGIGDLLCFTTFKLFPRFLGFLFFDP